MDSRQISEFVFVTTDGELSRWTHHTGRSSRATVSHSGHSLVARRRRVAAAEQPAVGEIESGHAEPLDLIHQAGDLMVLVRPGLLHLRQADEPAG